MKRFLEQRMSVAAILGNRKWMLKSLCGQCLFAQVSGTGRESLRFLEEKCNSVKRSFLILLKAEENLLVSLIT